MHELNLVPEFLTGLLEQPGSIALIALLLIAATIDVRSHRIPNWLTGGGIVIGLLFAAVGVAPQHGFLSSLGGMALGLAMLLPMYLLRVMGAGDVKLMAMVGAFVAFPNIFYVVLFSFVAGGIAAVAFALQRRAILRMTNNVLGIVQWMAFAAAARQRITPGMAAGNSVGRLPYGVSIAAGTIAWLVARQLGLA